MNAKTLGCFLIIFFSGLAIICVQERTAGDELFLRQGMPPLFVISAFQASNVEIREESRKLNWYDHYISYLFQKNALPAAYVRRKLLEGPATSPLPSLRETPSPISSPTPSAPPPFFKIFNDSTEERTSGDSERRSNLVGSQPQKHDISRVVVAVVVTAAVSFVLVGMMFLCYRKCCYGSKGPNHNDERPLLNLNMSDFSVGSLHISFGSSPSSRKNSFSTKNTSETPSPSSNAFYPTKLHAVSLGAPVCVNARVPPPLKPPPGRIDTFAQEKLPPNQASHLQNSPVISAAKMGVSTAPSPPMAPLPPLAPIPPRPLRPSPGSSRPPLPPPPPVVSNTIKSGFQPPPPPPPQKRNPPPPIPPPKPMFTKGSQNVAVGPAHQSNAGSGEDDGQKTKLKPFFWDKVLASPDHSMVWHQIKSGSFQFNEEMIESLFGYAAVNKDIGNRRKDAFSQDPSTSIQIIDPKKAQNLSILLRALNVTIEEVCDALVEGNELPSELVETLLRVAPTPEEELKLRLFDGELSLISPAERFLKILVNIPFAFRRLESLLFVHSLQEEISSIKYSFSTMEVACKELRSSRLFLKLLEAVLKTGNRMNVGTFRGGAQAFKLDTLLKLSDVKGTDGKTTLLHFVVQEIIRSEGIRAFRMVRENSMSSVKSEDLMEGTNHESDETYYSMGLEVVSGLSSELVHVKKVAALDADGLAGNVSKLGRGLARVNDFLSSDMRSLDEDTQFRKTLESFTEHAQVDISWLSNEEKRIVALVKSTADYFHGNPGKDEGLRLFVIVSDFLIILDKVCKEVRKSQRRPIRQLIKPTSAIQSSPEAQQRSSESQQSSTDAQQPSRESHQPSPSSDLRTLILPAITDRRVNSPDSDEDSP